MEVVVFLFLLYVTIGVSCAITLRWGRLYSQEVEDEVDGDQGTDLLLDILFWPILVYFAVTHRA